MESEKDNTQFFKQRRNLLIISLVLFIISFAEINFQNLSFGGAKVQIGNPIVIYILIYIVFIYMFIRYIHYYGELDYWSTKYYDYTTWEMAKKQPSSFFSYLFSNIWAIFIFILNIIFKKDFIENFFPILLAIFVAITSYYSPFIQNQKNNIYSEISNFANVIQTNIQKDIPIKLFDVNDTDDNKNLERNI
jgi:hypothetical protein